MGPLNVAETTVWPVRVSRVHVGTERGRIDVTSTEWRYFPYAVWQLATSTTTLLCFVRLNKLDEKSMLSTENICNIDHSKYNMANLQTIPANSENRDNARNHGASELFVP